MGVLESPNQKFVFGCFLIHLQYLMMLMVGGTRSSLLPSSFVQALPVPVVGAVGGGVDGAVGAVVGGVDGAAVGVVGGEMVRHAYVAPATTATLEPASWLDIDVKIKFKHFSLFSPTFCKQPQPACHPAGCHWLQPPRFSPRP